MNIVINPWETCRSCQGSGLTLSCYSGEPTECYECDGNTVVRARDNRGRFVGNSKPADPIVSELLCAHLLDVLPKWVEQDRLSQFSEDMRDRIQESM